MPVIGALQHTSGLKFTRMIEPVRDAYNIEATALMRLYIRGGHMTIASLVEQHTSTVARLGACSITGKDIKLSDTSHFD